MLSTGRNTEHAILSPEHLGRPPAGDKEAAAVLSAQELEARRWDGYRGMVAPQLLGSWNWPGATLQAGYETRMRAAIDAMLNRLPFWYSVRVTLDVAELHWIFL